MSIPPAGNKLALACTQTIQNFAFVVKFAPGVERYFEDSTQFVGVLRYKNSTFVLQYEKSQNTFRLAVGQALGEGTYTLTLSSIMCTPAGSGCTNCFVQYSFEVEYVNDPDWGVSIQTDPTPAMLTCFAGSQVVLKGSPLPHSGFQAQWSRLVGTQFVPIAGATSSTYVTTQSGTYLYVVSGPAGCRASNLTSVKPPERPIIQLDKPQQTLDNCTQPIVGVSVADAGNNLTFTWTALQGGIILSGNHTLSPIIGAPGVYTLIAKRADNGCADTAAINVIAGDIPVVIANINSVSGTDILDCKVRQITLSVSASLSKGTSAFTYLWSTGDQTEQITVSQPGIYAVTITAVENGCIGYSDKAVFQNIQPPTATIFSTRDTVCAGESAVLSVSTPEPATFRWSNGSSETLLTVTPAADGSTTYTVTVTSTSSGCSTVVEKTIVRISAPPLTCSPTDRVVSHGETVDLNCITSPLAQIQWTATSANVANIPSSGIGAFQRRLELASINAPGRIEFTVFARRGACASLPVQVSIKIIPPSENGLYIPEVITPDSDGENSTWKIVLPVGADPSAYKILIYDRRGALVWEDTLANPFSADKYPDGAYFYVLTPPIGAPIRGAVSIVRKR